MILPDILDVDLRPDRYDAIVLSGGTAHFPDCHKGIRAYAIRAGALFDCRRV